MKRTLTRAKGALLMPLGLLAAALLVAQPASAARWGIHSPVTPGQRATAQEVATRGVPLSALAPNAPDSYTVRRGDTLWHISGIFLKSPWRWPELWGMNLKDIQNPHLIFPGQQLFLVRSGGRAWLRTSGGDQGGTSTVHMSPHTRTETTDNGALPALDPQIIEPFLTESLIVDAKTLNDAPRVVALADRDRVVASTGDRVYARGPTDAPLLKGQNLPTMFRVFRSATPLKDPITGEILGYEGQYVGKARLVRGETEAEDDTIPESHDSAAEHEHDLPVPATADIISTKQEVRTEDRLIPEPPRDFRSYVPHAPSLPIAARVVQVHGNAVRYAGQNEVVIINKGLRDGIENGDVLAVMTTGPQIVDKTGDKDARIKLPDERNGLAMVFRPFERASYALIMEITNPVSVGDKLVNPK